MPQFPSLPDNAHLTDLLKRFPKTVTPLMDYLNAVLRGDGELTLAEREMIAAYVSGLNACTFCFGSHLIYAQAFGIPDGMIENLLQDPDRAEPKWRPLLAYLRKLNSLPSRLTEADAAAVFAEGWSEEALFEAIEVAAVFNMMNRMVEGGGVRFDYAQDPQAHSIAKADPSALEDSYLKYGQRIRDGAG